MSSSFWARGSMCRSLMQNTFMPANYVYMHTSLVNIRSGNSHFPSGKSWLGLATQLYVSDRHTLGLPMATL